MSFKSRRVNNKNRLQTQKSGKIDSLDMLGSISYRGYSVASDYELTIEDNIIGVDTSGGPVTITVPDATDLDRNFFWQVYKITPDTNPVTLQLAVPSQAFSPSYASIQLLLEGQGYEIKLYAAPKIYWYGDVGAVALTAHPQVVTDKPVLTGTDLYMEGQLESLGSYSSVTAEFRYRTVGGTSFTTVGTQVRTTTGTFSYTEAGVAPAPAEYEVQAIIKTPDGQTVTGSIRTTDLDFYESAANAAADDLIRYWDLQENGGGGPYPTGFPTLVNGTEKFATGEDFVFFNNCDVDTDTINGQTIYKRRLGTSGYAESPFVLTPGQVYTIFLQVKPTIFTGDHTIINFGTNVLSLGVDNTTVQLEVNGFVTVWSGASAYLAAQSMGNLCICVDPLSGLTTLRSVDTTLGSIPRAASGFTPSALGSWIRLGRGAPGDANHQDFEFLGTNANPGEIRSLAIWDRILLDAELVELVSDLDVDGGLIF